MNLPCKNCITLPICRHKDYGQLTYDCSLVMKWVNFVKRLPNYKKHDVFFTLITTLDPSRWSVTNEGGEYTRIIHI